MRTSTCALVLLLLALFASAQTSFAQAPPPSAEPSVREVVRMALAAAKAVNPRRTRELARRARLAGLVPTLRVGAQRGLEQDLSSSVTIASDRTNTSSGDAFSIEATLSFDLPRLVFASDEVRLISIERWLDGDRRKLVEDVVRLYFKRKRLVRERLDARAPDPEVDAAIEEIEALLDAYTEGAYLEALARARADARAPQPVAPVRASSAAEPAPANDASTPPTTAPGPDG